ncbi:DedA family protein [Yoonia sp.]|uniref:DedA family protein n=1 Tax=Yoonia sp. TaxID=2212373 RepID=UPI00391923D4
MENLIADNVGNPVVLVVLLFLATFVLEEAAILIAAGLAASGELPAGLALAAIASGIIVSDWCLYGIGVMAVRNRRIARWVSPARIDLGRSLLQRNTLVAGLIARIIPWLLFPIFVASGFLGVGFVRFALINAAIALIYVLALFYGAFGLSSVLIDWIGNWAWLFGAGVLLVMLWGGRAVARRYLVGNAPPDA